jgi:diguanylate cyclase (GGDEF)-like protein
MASGFALMRVVVVDPSRTVLKAVSRLLANDGHDVSTFVDGPEALAHIKSDTTVGALITSAELTTMSGVELCWETRLLSGRDRAIYIILMSSNSEQKHLVNALDSGADEFIRKPPAGEELYARLRSAERLVRLQRELIRLATIDPLTGVLTHRAFFEKAQQAFARAAGMNPITAIMFDVDHFKQVNDTHGHDVGDQVLRGISQEAQHDGPLIGRLGGEEFAILLEGSNLDAGVQWAESLRARIAGLSFKAHQGGLAVTCSLGVSQLQGGETIDRLLKRADLYQAKNGGRNRVVAARPSAPETDEAPWSGVVRSSRGGSIASQGRPAPELEPPAPLTWWSSNPESAVSLPSNAGEGPSCSGNAYVLDDEPQIGALVCKVLEACGIMPRQFTSPSPFLAELDVSPPDLIVLDLSLGQSDAVEIMRHLEGRKFAGKVLLISGRDEATLNDTTEIGRRHGLTMLPPLRKPFRPRDLKERLAAQAGTQGEPRSESESKAPKAVLVQLAEALRGNWLELWYQPKVDLKSLTVNGAEALVRARHPTLGLISPANLLPPAGDPGYEPLTEFVIAQAIADWCRFADRGLLLKLSVNVPVSVLHAPDFIARVRSLLPADASFPGLTIEVTEDEIIRDPEWARELATQLKLYNVGISIDDFGSAYASLSRLNDLPFMEVKIDRSFVSGCASNKLKHSLCRTVVDLAHRFGATACAEGVETPPDLRALIETHCDAAQGYLFAKPMPPDELIPLLLAQSGKPMLRLLDKPSGGEPWLARTA